MPTVTPMWSDLICDAFGVNVHYQFATTVYGNSSSVTALVKDLGVRYIRDRMSPNAGAQRTQLGVLAAAGIKAHVSMGVYNETSQSDMNALCAAIALNPSYYASVGGCNEPNNEPRVSNWATITKNHQQMIWDTMNTYGLGSIPVVGPSLKDNVSNLQADFNTLGATGIASYVDKGDFHRYPLGGGGTLTPSNGFDNRVSWASSAFGGKPLFCTETGMNNMTGRTPEWATGVYAPRLLMEAVYRGIERTFIYELLDDPDPSGVALEAHFGLVATPNTSLKDPSQWRKKPAFQSLRALSLAMADPGAAVSPSAISLTVSGGGSDLRWVLAGKRTGETFLIIWRDTPVYNHNTRQAITVTPQNITITSPFGTKVVAVAGTLIVVNLGTGEEAPLAGSTGGTTTDPGTGTGTGEGTGGNPDSTPAGYPPRRAYDRDGTVVTTVTGATATPVASGDVETLNGSSASGGITVGSKDWLALVFPTTITVGSLFAAHDSTSDLIVDMEKSADTTDGEDGTWTSAGTIKLRRGDTVESDGTWLTQLVTGLAIECRGLRIGPGTSKWLTLHVHGGGEAEDPPGLKIRNSAYEVIPSGAINWGSVPRGSSADTTVVVANTSAQTAVGVVMSIESAEDGVEWAETHYLSTNGRDFAATVDLGTIGPYSRSTPVTVRRATPDGATLGAHAARLVAVAASWT